MTEHERQTATHVVRFLTTPGYLSLCIDVGAADAVKAYQAEFEHMRQFIRNIVDEAKVYMENGDVDYDSIAQLSEVDAKLVRIIEVAKDGLTSVRSSVREFYANDYRDTEKALDETEDLACDALNEIAKLEVED